jgi:hypothetical protein
MTYIKVYQAVRDHRKITALSDALDIEEFSAIGLCVTLWLWAVDNAPDGVIRGTDRAVARGAGWHGDPHVLVRGLVESGLLDEETKTGRELRIHDWDEHAGALIHARERNRERMRRARDITTESTQNVDVRSTSIRCAQHNRVACDACAERSDVHVRDKNRVEKSREDTVSNETVYTVDFIDFWSHWPKKGDAKLPAFKAWRNLSKAKREAARTAIPLWLAYYASIENRHIPNCTTWLNQARWEVDPPPVEQSRPQNGNGRQPFVPEHISNYGDFSGPDKGGTHDPATGKPIPMHEWGNR